MVNYSRAIERPFTDSKKLLIGVLLNLPIPLVGIVTNTLVSGYVLYCGKTARDGKYKMPEWENYWDLLVKGIFQH